MSNFFRKLFNTSNKIRVIIINGFFWLFVIIVILLINSSSTDVITGETLYIQFSGNVIETPADDSLLTIVTSDNFEVPQQTVLRSVLESVSRATYDKKIKNMVLDLDYLSSIGLGVSEEIGNVLKLFRDSGKNIFAFSSYYNRGQYYLASFATEISMDPYGEVDIEGISVFRNYWKDALEKYNVDVKIFRAGEFKSYVEPYLSNKMSQSVKDQNLKWMSSIWDDYLDVIGQNRLFDSGTFDRYFNKRLTLMKKYNGDASMLAKEEGFVNILETKNEFLNRQSSLYHYLDYNDSNNIDKGKLKVAVVTLDGTITYSDTSQGSISAVDTELILDNVLFSNMDGLILRINSGGGGVFASETIRRKVLEIKENIPVIISMGDVCASGGYWIATASDTIYADSNTITGSIGVFGMLFGLEDTLSKNLGVFTDGVSTTPNLEPVSLTNNISDEVGEIIQLSVENTYSRFLNIVSESRGIEKSKLLEIAEGRVWSGKQALDNGLIDFIGGINQAEESFGKSVELVYMDKELPLLDKFLKTISGGVQIPQVKFLEELSIFDKIKDPKNTYALWY